MLPLLAPLSSLLSAVALMLLGNGLLNTLLTLRGVEEGYSTSMLGLIMSGYFVGYLLGTWTTVPLIRRIGHIRSFALFAAMCASIALLHVLLVNPWVWLLLRVAYGVALIGLYMVVESWLNAVVANAQRGRVFAVYMVVNLCALAIAQQLLNLAHPTEFTLFALAAMLLCWALVPVTLTRRTQPSLPETHKVRFGYLVKIAPLALVASGISGLAMGGFWGMAPVYANMSGFDAAGVGLLMSCAIIGGAVLQWPIGLLSDRGDRRLVLLWVVCLALICSTAMLALDAGAWLLGLIFVWGGLAFAIYPIGVAQLLDQLHPDEVLSGSSGLLMVNGIGSICGPLLAGAMLDHVGPHGLPLFFSLSLGGLAMYIFLRRQRVCDLVNEPQAQFVPMLRTSPTVLELMPDAPHVEHPVAAADAQPGEAAEAPGEEQHY
jgi:MFS family permease